MTYLQLPIYAELAGAQTILLAGAGGGFDIFSGLPLYFGLKSAGKTVHLANLSFSTLYASNGKRLAPALVRVDAKTAGDLRYFPEKYLADWFATQGENVPIYCFDRTGFQPLYEAYRFLTEELKPDAIVLVDGGTDSLMRGDEAGLGTPEEDIASLLAVFLQEVPKKLLVCLGFGVDTFHGVCHAQFLEAVAAITQAGGFLGAWSLIQEMPEVKRFREASDYVLYQMRHHPSIVTTSILSALEGRFGDYHASYRTEGSKLFINPLMTLYWGFQLDAVAERILYRDAVCETTHYHELTHAIMRFRAKHPIRDWENIPL